MFIKMTLLVLILGSCSLETKHQNSTSIDRGPTQAAWNDEPNGLIWSGYAIDSINRFGQELLTVIPSDIEKFCPNYAALQPNNRALFWTALISKLAKFESNHKPEANYRENFRDTNGHYIISRGLLQISIESANGYSCGIGNENELHNPFINIECGVKILNRWVGIKDGVITKKENQKWQGAARYWSPFRDANKTRKMAAFTSAINLCKQ